MSSGDNMPLVSISMAAYNHEKYVQEAIQSVIDQDYPRIELIVIDDGSTDSTWQKIQEMKSACEKRFERVILKTRENRGRVATGREIAALRRGEFVGGLASDDRYTPCAVSQLIQPMLDDPEIGVTVGINIIIDSASRRCYWDANRNIVYNRENATYTTFDDFIKAYSGVDFSSSAFGSYEEIVKNNHIANGQLRRASIYSRIIPYDDNAPLEDLWLNLQVAKVVRFKHVPVETFCYRWHGANTVANTVYMDRIWMRTMLRELVFVEKDGSHPSLGAIWRSVRLPLEYDVIALRFWRFYLRVRKIRYWKFVQYMLYLPKFKMVISPRIPV